MSGNSKIGDCIQSSLEDYFTHLDGEQPHAVYDMVLSSVEKPMLEYILRKVGGNQSKAAEVLGINRNTLRKKMAMYHLD
ncbi:MAG: helix-turn-helix domain-containing protein [Methylophilaceae bacterium]|jgi:Fis family transcriptional regulator, factor for inversion stimulation protein|nr:helix-turn-helix domain-containing protein [Methylophilaceae bacterium]MDG1445764.1 helix-turn-helix domain-containing protein [Methylophilaceae bacterium]